MHWARVHNSVNSEAGNKRKMDAPPGQFTALQAFNMLKEIVSGYVMI